MTMPRYITFLVAGTALALTFSMTHVRARGGLQPPARANIETSYRENNVGVGWLEQFNYASATERFSAAIKLDPDNGIFHFNQALALFYDSKLDAAAEEARTADRLLPSSPKVQYVIGLIAKAQNRAEDAAAAFARVLAADPSDAAAAIGLGQSQLQLGQAEAAAKSFRQALDAEPYNATAAYNLSMALSRAGRADEARAALERFQKLRESGIAVTLGNGYLQQGRYADAMLSTGLEPALVDFTTPAVRFTDVPFATSTATATAAPAAQTAGAVTPIDIDGDGDLDLIEVSADGEQLWINDGRGRFSRSPRPLFSDRRQGSVGLAAVSADVNNDGRPDVLVLRRGDTALYENGPNGFTRIDVGKALQELSGDPLSAALVDYDHDGDLDVLIPGTAPAAGAAASTRVLRNDGNGRFTDVTAATQISGASIVGIVPTDYDEHRDVDFMFVSDAGPLALYRNLRTGSFAESARAAGLPAGTGWSALAAGDLNKDGRTDFVIARANDVALFALSDGRGHFTLAAAPEETSSARAIVVLDYDNDGLPDLLAFTPGGARLLRNVGKRWVDVTREALPKAMPVVSGAAAGRAIAVADFDGDGDEDLVIREMDGLHFLRNDGGNAQPSIAVKLTGRSSNRKGVGATVDVRAGSLRDHRDSWAVTPAPAPADLLFGLGKGRQADVVRILWPSGTVQAEMLQASQPRVFAVTELDRKPSSCPFLYAWNGERFDFITDFLGGGEFGYWESPGVTNVPDPDEYVRIPGDTLQPRDGAYDLRVTNELEETLYLDFASLQIVDVPSGVEVFPDEGMVSSPQSGERLVLARNLVAPRAATDDRGRDVTALVTDVDFRAPADFAPVLANVRGYALPHSLTISRDARDAGDLLLLTGWTDYAFSTDNFAAAQSGLRLSPPVLEVRDAGGTWRRTTVEVPIPIGRPQTVVVNLRRAGLEQARELRIATNMRICWDRVRFAAEVRNVVPHLVELTPEEATLRDRGYSREWQPNASAPVLYDYTSVSSAPRWKRIVGEYTGFGDVRPLLASVDDRFVIAGPGDEVALRFRAPAGNPAPGMTRTFLLRADGFSKEMDLHSASPDSVRPLPYHGMTQLPEAGRAKALRYGGSSNDFGPSRMATRPLPSLESLLTRP